MAKTTEQLTLEAKELITKRELMGLTRADIYNKFNINQGNYSRMERGQLNPEKPLNEVRQLFKEWVPEKVSQLRKQIKELQELSK